MKPMFTNGSRGVRHGVAAWACVGLVACATAPADPPSQPAAPPETASTAAVPQAAAKVMPSWDAQKAALSQQLTGPGITVTDTAEGLLKLSLPSDGLFAVGSASVGPAFAKVLDRIAEAVNRFPDTLIEVVGHTDATGTDAINLALSAKRAENTRDYLSRQQVAPERIGAQGWGADQPVADNGTAQGRAANRRVEIFVKGR